MSSERTVIAILALLTCTMSGCGNINTRIGWPWDYWQHGSWAVVGFFAVCCLVFLGFKAARAKKHGRRNALSAVVLLLVAGVLLQTLPHAAGGLQFVPLPPWDYDGWIARIVSVACWLTFAFVGLLISSPVKDDQEGAAYVLLVAFGLNALLSFAGPADAVVPNASDQPPAFVQSCQGKIEEWEKLRDERLEALKRLVSDRSALIADITNLAVTSKRELMAHPVGRTLAEELEQLSRQIVRLQSETDAIASVLERAQSTLRRIEREVMLQGLSVSAEAESDRLSQMDHQLQEELRKLGGEPVPGTEVRIDKVLDAVFSR